MPEFTYEAMADGGTKKEGTMSAASEREVMAILDRQGLFPIKINQAKKAGGGWGFGGGIKTRYMAMFYAQLADLLHSGVPLLRSLDILSHQTSTPALADIIRDIREKVADGSGLAEAMSHHPKAFNELAVSMVRAGQEGGFLEDVLHRIAEFVEHQEDLKAKVVGAMAYPIFLAIIGFAVLNVLVIFFVPKFQPIFDKLQAKNELPGLTTFVMNISHFIQAYWWIIGGAFLIFLVAFIGWARTEDGRYKLDAFRLWMPGAGNIYRNLAISRFTRILGTMLQNGIPILNALRISKDSTGNKVLAAAIEKSAENIKAGDSLATPLRATKHFPRDIVEMVTVGEESNNLERVLLNISEGLEKRTSRQLELFVRLLEPLMLLVMAGLTLVVVVGLLLPVFKLSSAIG